MLVVMLIFGLLALPLIAVYVIGYVLVMLVYGILILIDMARGQRAYPRPRRASRRLSRRGYSVPWR